MYCGGSSICGVGQIMTKLLVALQSWKKQNCDTEIYIFLKDENKNEITIDRGKVCECYVHVVYVPGGKRAEKLNQQTFLTINHQEIVFIFNLALGCIRVCSKRFIPI